jgi:hypothetical protein
MLWPYSHNDVTVIVFVFSLYLFSIKTHTKREREREREREHLPLYRIILLIILLFTLYYRWHDSFMVNLYRYQKNLGQNGSKPASRKGCPKWKSISRFFHYCYYHNCKCTCSARTCTCTFKFSYFTDYSIVSFVHITKTHQFYGGTV